MSDPQIAAQLDPALTPVQTRHGMMLVLAQDIYVGRSLITYGEWCPSETRLLSALLRPGDVVVEVGANHGAHSLALARAVGPQGRVYAIEPQPRLHQLLSTNAALNGLSQIIALQLGLGQAAGWAHLPDVDYSRPGNFGGLSLSETTHPAPHGTPVAALDDLLDLDHLRLLKIDAEGAEPQILRGARQTLHRHRPVIYAEADQPSATQPILNAVRGLGYRAYWHVSPLFVADNYKGETRNTFGDTACINMLLVPDGFQVRSPRPVAGPDSHPRSQA